MQERLLDFARHLSAQGLGLSTAQTLDALRAAATVGPQSPRELMYALRACWVNGPDDFDAFAEVFERFFTQTAASHEMPPPLDRLGADLPGLGLVPARGEDRALGDQGQSLASPAEVLGRTGFDRLDPGQAALMVAEVKKLLRPLAKRLSRRRQPWGRDSLAWRATIRRSLAAGGEVVELKFRRRKKRRRRLVVLADVSGSMELSAPYIFHFLAGLAAMWRQVEVFVFATRLTRVTPWLAHGDVDGFTAALPRLAPDLAGGTRLGGALSELQRRHGTRLAPSTVAMIVSDGWDRGDPAVLRREMARLHRRCRRVVWLNPLLESPDYQPLARGMATALPHVDHFLACHNLASLQKVAQVLSRVMR